MAVTAQPIVTAERRSALLASVPTGLLIGAGIEEYLSTQYIGIADPYAG